MLKDLGEVLDICICRVLLGIEVYVLHVGYSFMTLHVVCKLFPLSLMPNPCAFPPCLAGRYLIFARKKSQKKGAMLLFIFSLPRQVPLMIRSASRDILGSG